MNKKIEACLIYLVVYITATIAALISLKYLFTNKDELILNLFKADLIGSIFVYLNCILFDSFSLYDPYWSVKSTLISIYLIHSYDYVINLRTLIVLVFLNIWSNRLTCNLFLTAVEDINHEDWRYSDFRKKWSPKVIYCLMGLLSFILLPTIIVFFGNIPVYYVVKSSHKTLNFIDLIAIIVTLVALYFESVGDYQLRRTFLNAKKNGKVCKMDSGLWSLCRHPNYFGEILYWFGMYLFGISAGASPFHDKLYLTTFFLGPFAVFILIYFGSMPLMEERQLKRKTEFYKNYMKRVPFKILPLSFLINHSKSSDIKAD
jgi:steroid 5-alpha reductase family enzyme